MPKPTAIPQPGQLSVFGKARGYDYRTAFSTWTKGGEWFEKRNLKLS